MPPHPESGEPEPEDDLSPDDPESSLPPVDSEDERREEEDDDEETEEHPTRKRDRETVELEADGILNLRDQPEMEVPVMVKPLRTKPPAVDASEQVTKRPKTYGALFVSS
jgi:hypothetical protein